MIEGLAKTIGYDKVHAITSSMDSNALRKFVQESGMAVKIFVSAETMINNGVTAVPVTIVETTDGKKTRFDGLTETFSTQPPAALPAGPKRGGQCEAR